MSPVLPEVEGETANHDSNRVDTAAAASTTVDGGVSSNLSTEMREAESKGERIVAAGSTARVLLPATQTEDTDEDDEEDREEQEENNDFLVDFPDDTPELELLHSRIKSLANLHLPRFAAYLKKLCLRQNLISYLDPDIFHQLTLLEELDLYDNKIRHIDASLDRLQDLKVLDLSFNLLRGVPDGLEHLRSLETIYFVQNKISKITGLNHSTTLRSLELGGNRIRKIEGLEALVNLEELWLGKNKITKLEGLGNLKKLKVLSIQSNRITKLENLEALSALDQFYISHNGIERLEGLDHNNKLTTLDVGSNFISTVENIAHLTNLEELWMSGNKVPDLRSVEAQLRHLQSLQTLYLEGNPCQTSDAVGYRRKVILALPQLTQLDATYVRGP
ncbi:hypothetical protein AGABI1DRAFT_75193 [Agaricus bisporus var. burnettii JB137-S8]|uniref:U2A'/phosphoprotein 32 family A C-terminal domain-containing protein n=1 Tax=Agaricus bisporus var. burnettii (strain JB137-S8 / ATCC MYA-4627 / FGSC 10392) TaxID=597362 RepID=K5X6C7_AGABU|nr:uncharacterized protein AGABI1DRAFT_75193 [Agaricus bisporus var. burnettii JB137-S8]EKM78738.1 hypothetical protein AGABI1DRAFT_75193 [Agaricus bisporus var. burnettii JB137-S8]